MAEYIERKRAIVDACNALELYPSEYAKLEDALNRTPAADVECGGRLRGVTYEDGKVTVVHIRDTDDVVKVFVPVRHGRWIRSGVHTDHYFHHRCSACNESAPFDYKYREDWDEGMDGEWYSLGLVDDGINEHLTPYCPNCGAKMELED